MGDIAKIPIPQPTQIIIDTTSLETNQDKKQGHTTMIAKRVHTSILTKFHAGYFRISVSIACQALLWKILSQLTGYSSALHCVFRFLPSSTFLLLWCLAILSQISLSILYVLKCIFHFDLVKTEFSHHVGVNYLYAPWISWLLILQSSPWIVPKTVSFQIIWWVLATPVAVLDIKIYGQWFTTESRFLSRLANPTSQISVIGNLVGAQAAAQMGLNESAVCMFSLGMAHYLVLFVTLYQRLSGKDCLPTMLRPSFFLLFAAPSMASLAWNSISGAFGSSSKILFFLSLFLFISLACRPALFKKSMKKFNVAWWAYSFSLTFLALASAKYAEEVKGSIAPGVMLILSAVSVLVFLGLMLLTALKIDRLLRENDPFLSFTSG